MAGENTPDLKDMGIDPNTGAGKGYSSIEALHQERAREQKKAGYPSVPEREWESPVKYAVDASEIYASLERLIKEGQDNQPGPGEAPSGWEKQAQNLMGTLAAADDQAKDMTAPLVPEGTPPNKWAKLRQNLVADLLQKYQNLAGRPAMYATKYDRHRPIGPLGQLGQDMQPGPGELPSAPPSTPAPESGGGESSGGSGGGAPSGAA